MKNKKQQMAKPILVVRIPYDAPSKDVDRIHEGIKTQCSEYNVITIPTGTVDRLEFEVFNVQDYPQIEFDQLKQQLQSIWQDNTELKN